MALNDEIAGDLIKFAFTHLLHHEDPEVREASLTTLR